MSLLFHETCLNERLLPNHTHTHTHTHIYIYIYMYGFIYMDFCMFVDGHQNQKDLQHFWTVSDCLEYLGVTYSWLVLVPKIDKYLCLREPT